MLTRLAVLVLLLLASTLSVQGQEHWVVRDAERVPFRNLSQRLEESGVLATVQEGKEISHEERVVMIRHAYELLEDYARSDVSDLHFELSDFSFVEPEEFARRLYTDLMTMPGGLMIDVTRREHVEAENGTVRRKSVQYVPRWVEEERPPLRFPDGRLLEDLYIHEVIADWQRIQAHRPPVELITTFRVEAHLRGESRAYRSAFFWSTGHFYSPGEPSTLLHFDVLDQITQGVAEAASEAEPPLFIPDEPRETWTSPATSGIHCAPCETEDEPEEPEERCIGCSPILLDLGGGGFRLTSAAQGVDFDLNADGERERVAWTEAGGEDAFLAMDRNRNGVLENGKELFGDVTPQTSSKDPNGFLALRLFDQASSGGNEDGWLTAEDTLFAHLLLWVDENHDGVSQRQEMRPLKEHISALDLDYVLTRGRDGHGNEFRYLSHAHLAPGQDKPGGGVRRAVDVILTRDE